MRMKMTRIEYQVPEQCRLSGRCARHCSIAMPAMVHGLFG
jgi:hypothetical protein